MTENKDWKQKRMCPRCKRYVRGYPAVSRRDNKTEICSTCGTEEALWDYFVIKERSWLDEQP